MINFVTTHLIKTNKILTRHKYVGKQEKGKEQ
jgi:hypothetical protein